MDRPLVGLILPGAGRHGRQLPGAVLHALHRGRLLRPHQLHLHLRRFQEDDKAGQPQPHTLLLRPQSGHPVRLPLHPRYVKHNLTELPNDYAQERFHYVEQNSPTPSSPPHWTSILWKIEGNMIFWSLFFFFCKHTHVGLLSRTNRPCLQQPLRMFHAVPLTNVPAGFQPAWNRNDGDTAGHYFVKLNHTWIVRYDRSLDSVVVVCADCHLQEHDVTVLQGIDKGILSMDPVVSGSLFPSLLQIY